MQTFLPHAAFAASAAVLDRARLGKQRVEALQILRALLGLSRGWAHHPAVLMWRCHEAALLEYARAVCLEWRGRGYRDTMLDRLRETVNGRWLSTVRPAWLGDERLHSSHRAALLAKAPEWYGRLGWIETARVDYWWPVRAGSVRHGHDAQGEYLEAVR